MRRTTVCAIALLGVSACWAQSPVDTLQLNGQVRLQWIEQQTAIETELRASGHGLTSIVTLQQQRMEGRATASRAWVNELYAAHDGGAWQFSAGKKIVAWDVGYGFRPNDMVQQEERRTLVSSTAEGRPLLMAEHFSANTAWSWVWVNPTASTDAMGAKEPALALRVYQRDGAVDWHGFARVGAHTGASVGAAAAWVASDSMELHASANYRNRTDSKALIGASWTNQSQLSLLTEAWWDGSAPSMLRNNMFMRLSWQHDGWQPALDLLYTPADRGRALTVSVSWQGDRVLVQGGLRSYGGPANAVLMQLPARSLAFVATSWTF